MGNRGELVLGGIGDEIEKIRGKFRKNLSVQNDLVLLNNVLPEWSRGL